MSQGWCPKDPQSKWGNCWKEPKIVISSQMTCCLEATIFLPKRQQNKTAFLLRPDLGTGGGGVESRRIRRDPSPPLRGYDEVCCRCCCNCCSENGAGRWGRELDLNGHLDGRWRGCGGCDGVRPGGGPALTTATPDRESTCGGWWTRHHLKFRRSVFKHGAALIHL